MQHSVKFVANISKAGDKMIIIIPKAFHDRMEVFEGIQVKVTVEEAIPESNSSSHQHH